MIRFLILALYAGVFLPRFFLWAKAQVGGRISRMQETAFDTPGTESPVPPQVFLTGAGLLAGHFLMGHLFKMHIGLTWLGLLVGAAVGLLRLPQQQET